MRSVFLRSESLMRGSIYNGVIVRVQRLRIRDPAAGNSRLPSGSISRTVVIVTESPSVNGTAQSLQDISEPYTSGAHFQYLIFCSRKGFGKGRAISTILME